MKQRVDLLAAATVLNGLLLTYKALHAYTEYLLHSDGPVSFFATESALARLKEHNKKTHDVVAYEINHNTDYLLLHAKTLDAHEAYLDKLQSLVRKVCTPEQPTTIAELYGLLCQIGLYDLDDASELLACMGNVYIVTPTQVHCTYHGPDGYSYYVVPFPGWEITEYTTDTRWAYVGK